MLFRSADVVTVLSEDLAENVLTKLATAGSATTDVVVIPNFVDTEKLAPTDGERYRAEFNLGAGPVVMYAGNLGYSQSLDLMIGLAEQRPDITVVVNGDGAMRETIIAAAARISNLRYVGYQPAERLAEVLSAADIHVVPLRAGLGAVSVPSKTYSVLAVGRPVIAAMDADSAIVRLLDESEAGVSVPPNDLAALLKAVDELLGDPDSRLNMGARGREWVITHASPTAAALAYENVLAGTEIG